VNARYDEKNLKDGYAPFCKHIFIENDFTEAQTCVLPITEENEHLLRTKYEARTDKEVSSCNSRMFDTAKSCSFSINYWLILSTNKIERIIKDSTIIQKIIPTQLWD